MTQSLLAGSAHDETMTAPVLRKHFVFFVVTMTFPSLDLRETQAVSAPIIDKHFVLWVVAVPSPVLDLR